MMNMIPTRYAVFLAALVFGAGPTVTRAEQPGGMVDRVIAKLNDDIVMQSDLEEIIADQLPPGESMHGTLPVTSQTLGTLFDRTLLLQVAKREMVKVSEDEISKQVEQTVAAMKARYASETEFLKDIAAHGSSVEKLKEDLYKKTSTDFKLFAAVARRYTVTDTEVAKYEAEQRAQGHPPVAFRLRRLGVKLEGQGAGAEARAKEKLRGILDKITAQKSNFGEAVMKYSEVPGSTEDGGDLGMLSADKLSPQVFAAVDKLSVGEVSQPVVAAGFVSVFYVEGKRSAKSSLFDERFHVERQRLLEEMRRKAHLQVYDSKLVPFLPADYAKRLEKAPAEPIVTPVPSPSPGAPKAHR
ncbi:MAG: peptidylprolyl isomerase [Candidatus Sumerlaeaceae bacterium]|nr:peptidylprolyl isomerase [Candidatus Sumerlaeaceae bacterium]